MTKLPHCFNEASHAARTFVFLAASLLKVKNLQTFPVKLVVHPEAEGSDPCEADCGELATARSRMPTASTQL